MRWTSLSLACALVIVPCAGSFAGFKFKKPHVVEQAQKEADKVVREVKRAVTGHCRISIHNSGKDPVTIWSSTGKEKLVIKPGRTGHLKKTNIGDSTRVEANGGANSNLIWKSSVIFQNHISLEFTGKDLKRASDDSL